MALPRSGLAMMLSTLGIDPEEMVSKFTDLQKYIVQVDAALKRIEEKQEKILRFLEDHVEVPQDGVNNNGSKDSCGGNSHGNGCGN